MSNRTRITKVSAALAALLSLSACATSPQPLISPTPSATLLQFARTEPLTSYTNAAAPDANGKACDADVLVYHSGSDSYACGDFHASGTYHKTVFSNAFHTATRIERFDSYKACATSETPDIRAFQAEDKLGYYVVNAVWCIQQVD